jgi:prepilin-type N-terminal cleavage/methylation domain-containing protein
VTAHAPTRREGGFTLVELIVAITILGIIMGAIGAMIITAFRTSTTVSDELNGSRGPKLVARYWTPDVENATEVLPGAGGCGPAGSAVVTFKSASVTDPGTTEPSDPPTAPDTTVTWAVVHNGSRTQLRRFVCGPGVNGAATTVPELGGTTPTVEQVGTGPGRWVLKVTVPDRSQSAETFDFEVSGTQQVTPEPTP